MRPLLHTLSISLTRSSSRLSLSSMLVLNGRYVLLPPQSVNELPKSGLWSSERTCKFRPWTSLLSARALIGACNDAETFRQLSI